MIIIRQVASGVYETAMRSIEECLLGSNRAIVRGDVVGENTELQSCYLWRIITASHSRMVISRVGRVRMGAYFEDLPAAAARSNPSTTGIPATTNNDDAKPKTAEEIWRGGHFVISVRGED